MKIEREKLRVFCKGKYLYGEHWKCESAKKTLIIMHGGGTSSMRGFAALQSSLASFDIDTVAFDFLGHGDSDGSQSESTLENRTEQAMSIIRHVNLQGECNLIGFSMAAHNAIQISSQLDLHRLGLVIPAVYSNKAVRLKFGPLFSDCIRRPRSWDKSDCFDIVSEYRGKLLVVSAENDSVIPSEIPCRLMTSARCCKSAEHHRVRFAGHDLAAHYQNYPDSRSLILSSIRRWLD